MRWCTVLAASSTACLAQVASLSLSNGVNLRMETSFGQPTGQQTIKAETAPATGNSFYRIFRDQNGLAVYAYVLAIDRSDGDEFRIQLRPAGLEFAAKFPGADAGKPTPTLSSPRTIGPLASGKPVSIDVFEMPGTGEKVVDTVTLLVESDSHAGGGSIHLAGLKVYVNGALVSTPNSAAAVSGRYAMFYLPGRGGYFIASQPTQLSFVQAGFVDGRRMQFTMDNETFECVSDTPILEHADRGEVWVRHDPDFKPEGRWTEPLGPTAGVQRAPGFFDAASNSLSWWLR